MNEEGSQESGDRSQEGEPGALPVEPVAPEAGALLPEAPCQLTGPISPPAPERYPFWDYSDILIFIGLALPSLFAAELLVKGFLALFHLQPSATVMELLPAQFIGYLFLFGGLWAIFRLKYDRPFWRSLAWRGMRAPFSLVIICGFLAAFGVSIASNLIHTPDTSNPMTELMQGRAALIVMAAFGVTLGPLFEELAFRGFLQPLLVRSVGALGGVLLAAVPFGLLHYHEYGNSWRHALVISLAGASFGAMRQATGSTRAAALMHAAYNAFFFVALFARKG
jgi:membrane protease YdiL (CAAX protease family)